MSGHSKWASIKHKKAKEDARRGRIFGKISRAITVCVREGGKDVAMNSALATLIEKAKDYNMPQENIERAIKKGTGELSGAAQFETIFYEGYGPEGVALLVQVMTDNRNRAAADMRHIFSRLGGNLGEAGSVGWMFERKGLILLGKNSLQEDDILAIAIEAGAEDLKSEGDQWSVIADPSSLRSVRKTLEAEGLEVAAAEITMLPKNIVQLEEPEAAKKVLRLVDALEEHDDVQEVYANFDVADEIMESLAADRQV